MNSWASCDMYLWGVCIWTFANLYTVFEKPER